MSLRDLASNALCAPTTPHASHSANPLAHLADAARPAASSSTIPAASPSASASASASNASPASDSTSAPIPPDQLALLVGHDRHTQADPAHHSAPSSSALHAALLQPPQQPPALPAIHLPNLIPPHPVLHVPTLLPPVPLPTPGAPTDVFERAFESASRQHTTATIPSSAPHPAPSHLHPRPPPIPQHPGQPPHHAAWRNLQPSFAALSLNSHQHHLQLHHQPYLAHAPPHPVYAQPVQAQHHPAQPLAQLAPTESRTQTQPQPSASERVAATPKESPSALSQEHAQPEALSKTHSWGEEFTSLEGGQHHDIPESQHEAIDDLLFDDTLQSAFQQWLRQEDAQTYNFSQSRLADANLSATDALQRGIEAHREGRLPTAVLYLEHALSRSGREKNATPLSKSNVAVAWYLLGLSLADLDDDERAILALRNGVDEYADASVGNRREDNPCLWHSLIALSVSYTNEMQHGKALRAMREWLRLRQTANEGDGEAGTPAANTDTDWFRHATDDNDLVAGLNALAAAGPADVDVFTVLGILHNLNRDYVAAAGALRHAVTLRPEEPSLWNKLGATLANGGDNDHALRAYRKAVDLQPKLVRAWVNVGTAYANRSEHAKAMRYYLKAISMSEETYEDVAVEKGASKTSVDASGWSMVHVWGYVRSTLLSMSRSDLVHLVEVRDMKGLRHHFNF